jgi:uncharacterized protein (TIGR02001 family)
MRTSILGLSAIVFLATAAPALAQEEDSSAVKLTGSVTLVSDYRFRGFSQTSQDAAVQGGITATTSSGFYLGTWASSISFAGNTEIDLFAGYAKEVLPGLTADVGVLYYLYPKHGGGDTDFFEPYVNLTLAAGPATIKGGINYAWAQDALKVGASNKSAVYFHLEPSIAIPNTPIGLNAHLGYSESDAFPGGADGKVWDYSFGATATWKSLTFGISYVDTDEKLSPRGADGAVVFSLGAAF